MSLSVGANDGVSVGADDGFFEGENDGSAEGASVGFSEGFDDGTRVGECVVGAEVGNCVGHFSKPVSLPALTMYGARFPAIIP